MRRKTISERCGEAKNTEGADTDALKSFVEEYHKRIMEIESAKYDMEMKVMVNDFEISELTRKVTDLRGKFVKPVLKKVSKFEDKFAQLNKKASEFKFKVELQKADLS